VIPEALPVAEANGYNLADFVVFIFDICKAFEAFS
jgi:hypothetical protein